MSAQFGSIKIGAMQYNGVTIGEAMMNGQIVYKSGPPVVAITSTQSGQARSQFRAACTAHGVNYATVQELPFLLDTSTATHLGGAWQGEGMFNGCVALTTVPPMDTSNVTSMTLMFYGCSSLVHVPDMNISKVTILSRMFENCTSLTDGNVRLIGKRPSVTTTDMILNSGLTRLPFYNADGTPLVEFPVSVNFDFTGPGGSPFVVFEHTFQEDGMMRVSGSTTYRSPDLQLWINGTRRTLSSINEGQYGTYWYTGSDIRVHPGDVAVLRLPTQPGQAAFNVNLGISLSPVQ